MIAKLAHDDAPLAVDQNAVGMAELPVSTAFAADGSYMAAVPVMLLNSAAVLNDVQPHPQN